MNFVTLDWASSSDEEARLRHRILVGKPLRK